MKAWILGAIALCCASGTAWSDPVTYDFTVTATGGPLSGMVADGAFTFNSDIAPSGGGSLAGPGLFSALSFNWAGVTYNASSANTGDLVFSATGGLLFAAFGDDCVSATCPASSFPGSKDWFIAGPVSGSPAGVFAYASGNDGVFNGTVSFSRASSEPPPTSAPEPATLALLALGLAGVGLTRLKTARSTRRAHN